MRKVNLRMNEKLKYNYIKDFVDHGDNKHRLVVTLSLSLRQIDRLILVYKQKGKAGFIHVNRNRKSIDFSPNELDNKIIFLY